MIYTYMGVDTFRQSRAGELTGSRLPYTARLNSGEGLAADTSAGIKQMIKDKTPKKLKRKDIDDAMDMLGLTKVKVNGKVFYE